MAQRPLASVEDLAEYAKVPVKTVYEWNSKGTGPTPLKVGRHVRYRWAEIERWLDAQSGGRAA